MRCVVPMDGEDHAFSLGSEPAHIALIEQDGGPEIVFDAEPGEQARVYRVYS